MTKQAEAERPCDACGATYINGKCPKCFGYRHRG